MNFQNYKGIGGLVDGSTYSGLIVAREVTELLEILNKCFQGEKKEQ